MMFLKALEWAFGAFLVVFVIWQVIAPLLRDEIPFPAFRQKTDIKPSAMKEKKHV